MQLLTAPKTPDKPIPPMGDEPVKRKDIIDPVISGNENDETDENNETIYNEESIDYAMLNYSQLNYL